MKTLIGQTITSIVPLSEDLIHVVTDKNTYYLTQTAEYFKFSFKPFVPVIGTVLEVTVKNVVSNGKNIECNREYVIVTDTGTMTLSLKSDEHSCYVDNIKLNINE